MKSAKQINKKSALSFRDFVDVIYTFIEGHQLLVFVGCPIVLTLCCLLIAYRIEGHLPRNIKEYAEGCALPFILSFGTYMILFMDTGDHPAKGNEESFGCLLMIVYIPMLIVAYGIYRFVLLICNSLRSKKIGCRSESLEFQVKQLNKLRDAGLITKDDYDEQLSKLIAKEKM